VEAPAWLPWVVAGLAVVVWRRVVQGWMLRGRFGPRAAAAIYSAIMPALVLAAFAYLGRFGTAALIYATLGFALSYSFALFSFRRAVLIDRQRQG
jgi:hypothetical protein